MLVTLLTAPVSAEVAPVTVPTVFATAVVAPLVAGIDVAGVTTLPTVGTIVTRPEVL